MPLYEYRCNVCGHRFEKIQSFSAEPIKECPKCAGAVERLLNAPAFQFNGAGWYINDYSSKGSSGSNTAKSASDGGSSKDNSTADSAPAVTPPAAPTSSGSSTE